VFNDECVEMAAVPIDLGCNRHGSQSAMKQLNVNAALAKHCVQFSLYNFGSRRHQYDLNFGSVQTEGAEPGPYGKAYGGHWRHFLFRSN
jgi:hypothetical protein